MAENSCWPTDVTFGIFCYWADVTSITTEVTSGTPQRVTTDNQRIASGQTEMDIDLCCSIFCTRVTKVVSASLMVLRCFFPWRTRKMFEKLGLEDYTRTHIQVLWSAVNLSTPAWCFPLWVGKEILLLSPCFGWCCQVVVTHVRHTLTLHFRDGLLHHFGDHCSNFHAKVSAVFLLVKEKIANSHF